MFELSSFFFLLLMERIALHETLLRVTVGTIYSTFRIHNKKK